MKYFIFISLYISLIDYVCSDTSSVLLGGDVSKTQFMDLNEDVQLQIYKSLDLKDLFLVAQTNEYLSSLAAYEFKRKYADKQMMIFISSKQSYGFNGDDFEIHGAANILAFMKYFGTSILKLSFMGSKHTENVMGPTQMSSINKLINAECSEYLTEIVIENPHESFLNELTMPFKRVENVTLRKRFKTLDGSTLKFNELFPAMRRLNLPYFEILDEDSLSQTFPHLEHLSVGFMYFTDRVESTEIGVDKLIQSNPQIRSLTLGKCTEPLLRTISEILPDLEKLELIYYSSNDGANNANVISLKNLEVFILYPLTRFHISTNFEFENLVELHTHATGVHLDNRWWTNILRQSKNLKRLHLKKGSVHDEILETITSSGKNLTEISLAVCIEQRFDRPRDYTHVIQFVRANEQLEKIHFLEYHRNDLEPLAEALSGQIEDTWKMTRLSNEVSLERK